MTVVRQAAREVMRCAKPWLRLTSVRRVPCSTARMTASRFSPPSDYPRVKLVRSFAELVDTPLDHGINALCWERALVGDFAEVVARVHGSDGLTSLDEARLRSLGLSAGGRAAAEVLIADLELLRDRGLAPVLDCIQGYPRDEEAAPMRTDVYSFHADSAPVPTDTLLCTYAGASTEALRNDQAVRRIDVPATRAELLRHYGGADDAAFGEFLHEHCYDLHYAALPGAQPFAFGVGHFWRIAVEYPDSPVPPCIHRAPETMPGEPPRLLMIC